MRLPNTEYTLRPWRIHELTRDFRLEDVWELPTPGGPGDFPRLVQQFTSGEPAQGSSRVVGALFAIRWKIGELLGWDDQDSGIGSRVPTLRDRLPTDLREAASGPDFAKLPFNSVYLLDWEVRRSTPDLLLLGSDSRIGMPAELLLERRQAKLLFAAFLQHKNPIARAVWAATVPGHQRVVRSLLERVSSPEAAPRGEPAKAQEPRLARLRRAR